MWSRRSTGERQRSRRRGGAAGKSRGRWNRPVFRCRLDGTGGVAGRESLIISPADWLAYERRKPILRERSSAGGSIGIDNCRIGTFVVVFRGMLGERDVGLCTWKCSDGGISALSFSRRYDRCLLVGPSPLLGVILMCPGYRKMGNRPQSLNRYNVGAAE